MSRIGKMPVYIPSGIQVQKEDRKLLVKGPKGELSVSLAPFIDIIVEDGKILVQCRQEDRKSRAIYGTTRALIANAVKGVSEGYKIELDITGIGYRAEMQGNSLVLRVGYSHPVYFTPPEGVKVGLRSPVRIFVEGIDKYLVGQVAANIRAIKPPDPYKGTGIKYEDEVINLKPGKQKGKKK